MKNTFFSFFKKKAPKKRKRTNALTQKQVLSVKKMNTIPSRSQLRYLPNLLSAAEKRLALVALVLILIAGSLLSVRFLNTQRSEIPATGGEYTEGLIGAPRLMNPLYAISSDVDNDLSKLVYSGLMRYDSHHGLVPDLANAFTISEDQTEYTFTLRDDVEWHDGRPFRAADVIFTINAIQTPEYDSPLNVSFINVSLDQIDEQTVRFTLEEPFAPFLSLLTVGVLPSHLWGEILPINAKLADLNKKPIGTGPYEFEKFVRDSKGSVRSYTFKRNAQFYRGAPYIETLNFKFYPDLISGVEALRNNNVEGLSFIPTEEIETFEKDGDLQLIFPALSQYSAAFFNLEREEKLGDVTVREALAHATDQSMIIENVLNGHGRTINSFILEGMIGEHDNLPNRSYDLNLAKEKLEEAGWVIEDNSIFREKNDTPLLLEVVTLNSVELVGVAEEIKKQWAEIGVDVQITTVDNATFQSDILRDRSYDVLLSGELYGIDPDPYAFWHSSQSQYPGLNLSGFSNRNADDYIEKGRSSANRDDRADAYRSLQEIVYENVPAIFLYQPTYTYAVADRIQGIEVPQIVIPADRFSRIETWFIKTRRTIKKAKDASEEQSTEDLKEILEEINAEEPVDVAGTNAEIEEELAPEDVDTLEE